MTENELAELLSDCPILFHMAEAGSWPSIRAHGLLSTSALLDLYDVRGPPRAALEARRRPESVALSRPGLPGATLRDQKPMSDSGLARCLGGGMAPADWYRLLNRRVFLWPSPRRLEALLRARPYRDRAHDVLELDSAALVAAHRGAIALSAINSGFTGRNPAARGPGTFLAIADYPYAGPGSRRQPRGERVAELTVAGGVLDAGRFVRRVVRRGAGGENRVLFEAGMERSAGFAPGCRVV